LFSKKTDANVIITAKVANLKTKYFEFIKQSPLS
jgi:hypothetical protein